MPSPAHNGNIERVKGVLQEHHDTGLSSGDIADLLDITRDQAAALVRCLHTPSPQFPRKRVYIFSWRYEGRPGEKVYPRAVYRLGDARDTPKPAKMTGAEKAVAYRQRQVAKHRVSSVFNLASTTGYRTPSQRARATERDRKRHDRAQLNLPLFPDAIELNAQRKKNA